MLLPLILMIILTSKESSALTEREIIDAVTRDLPLIEEAMLKEKAAHGEARAQEGAFDTKLVLKTRNRIEETYDNQYFEATLEKATPYYGTALIAGHRQGRGHFPAYDGKYLTSSLGEVFAGLSLPLLRNRATDDARTELHVAQLEREYKSAEVELKKLLYAHKALGLSYKLRLTNQICTVRKEIFGLAEERQRMLQKKFDAGDLEKIKLTDNERSIDKRRDEMVKCEIDRAKLRAELGLYLKHPLPGDLLLTEELLSVVPNPLPYQESRLPQLRLLELERKALDARYKNADQSRLPGLNLEVVGTRELSPNAAYDPDTLQVGVKFDLPLENRKAEGKTSAYHYKLGALEKQREFLSRELQTWHSFSLTAMRESKERWHIVAREAKNAKTVADGERRRWQQGASNLYLVYLREQEVADTEIRKWTVLYEYLQYSLDVRLFSASLIH